MFEFIVRVAGREMAKKDTRLRQSIPEHKRVAGGMMATSNW